MVVMMMMMMMMTMMIHFNLIIRKCSQDYSNLSSNNLCDEKWDYNDSWFRLMVPLHSYLNGTITFIHLTLDAHATFTHFPDERAIRYSSY